jgi:multiple sugar transport system permease protein
MSARRWGTRLWPYTFVLPAALFMVGFLVYPVLFNVQLSLHQDTAATLLSGGGPWVGLDNYRAILANGRFWNAVWNTLVFTVGSMFMQVVLGLGLALLYHRRFPGAGNMGVLFLAAWVVPIVATGAVFRLLLDGTGVVNWLLQVLGLTSAPIYFLTDLDWAMPAVIAFNVWLGIPFNLVLLTSGLKAIPPELYEAASIDGAAGSQQLRYITLPMLRPTLLVVVMLGAIFTIKTWDVVWVTTRGGPVGATDLLSTFAYRLVFQQFQFGDGSAVLNLLAIILFAMSMAYLGLAKREASA